MSNPWNQFFGVAAPGIEILPFPIWMEHYPSADDKPIWLERYKLVHLANQGDSFLTRTPTLTPSEDQSNDHKAIHALYHAFFEDEKDREDMLLALKVGHTIAILDYNDSSSPRAIGAITFIYAKSKILTGIVLYLSVDAEFRRSGFGSYLISLMGLMISYRTNKDEVAICLYANSDRNPTSLSFYRKLGFDRYDDPKQEQPLPKAARLIMKCTSVYNTFFNSGEGMVWLYISDFRNLPLAETCQMSLMNPDVVFNEETGKASVCDAVYCQYPCGLNYADFCCVNEELPLFQNEVFFKEDNMPKHITTRMPLPEYSVVRVSIADRLRLHVNDPIPPCMIELVLAWLKKDCTEALWDEITIIPYHVVKNAYLMQDLLHDYMVAAAKKEEVAQKIAAAKKKSDQQATSDVESDAEFDENAFQSTFHDLIDNDRFMQCGQVVLDFIAVQHDIFSKPYILQLYREIDGDWSCQVSVNAGKMIEKEQPIKGDSVRGFINFDPYASVTDEHNPVACLSASLAPSNPFLFILTVAFELIRRNGGNDKVREGCKFVDLFPSTQQFAAFYCNLPLVFGPRLDAEDALFFSGDAWFVLLQISKNYPIQIDKNDENALSNSSVMSLLFLLDFCVTISSKQTFEWKVKGSVKMTPVEKDTCKFAIPESFKLGHYLKEKFDIIKVKSKRSLAITKIPAGQENAIKICFNSLIVLCDRIMKTDSAHFGKLRLHPRLQDFFSDEDKDEFPDFATAHQPKELIKDQSRVFNWRPSWCRVAAVSSNTVTQEEEEEDENAEEEKRKRDQLARDERAQDGKQDEHDTNAMSPSAKKPRRLYALEFESLLKEDEQVAANNDDDDDSYGHLPSLQKSPKKCRLRLPPKKKSPAKKKETNEDAELQKRLRPLTPKEKPNDECAAMDHCARVPNTFITDTAVRENLTRQCDRCKLLAHMDCTRAKQNRLVCLKCFKEMKEMAAQIPRKPKDPQKFLPIPPSLRGSYDEDNEPWASDRWVVADEAKWQMKQDIETEMKAMGYKTWSEMKVIMRNHNRHKQKQERNWEKLTEEEKHEYSEKNLAILKLRSDWHKGFRATQDRFLSLTPSFIPDLRYDKDSKQFIGLAQWQEVVKNSQGKDISLVNQQEIALSREFVSNNFKSDVIEYVRKATVRAGGSKFVPVPRIDILLDTRPITHLKYARPNAHHKGGRFVVRFADKEEQVLSLSQADDLFTGEFLSIVEKFAEKGFFNLPPGNAKPQCSNPISCKQFPIHFRQQTKDTCVCSSFASALWAVGLQGIAVKVAEFAGELSDHLFILPKIATFMSKTWLQPIKIRNKKNQQWPFPLLTADLQNCIALVVLVANDGSRSHAVTVHDGLIFDSNEDFALKLCQENLDSLCSTSLRQSTYVAVATGYLFQDQLNGHRINESKSKSGNLWFNKSFE